MDMNLKTVRKEMMAGDLKGIIDLPNYPDDRLVEVTVSSVAERKPKKILSEEEICAFGQFHRLLKRRESVENPR